MDMNRETILDELNDFEKRSTDISPILEDYLSKIAKTGDIMFPWNKLKPLIRKKLELVLNDFYESCPTDNLPPLPNVEGFKYEVMRTKILEAVDSFQSAPFTIQRLCELVINPRKHYKRTDKFMRGLEKNILVVSTVEPRSPLQNEVNNNNNAAMMVNGLISTTTPPDSNIINEDNSNNNSIHVSSAPGVKTSTVNGDPPLDNFTSVFSTAAHTVHTSSELEVSNVTQSRPFENPDSPETVTSHSGNDNCEDRNERLTESDTSSNSSTGSQQTDNAMDTSPDPSEISEEVEVDHQIMQETDIQETDPSSMLDNSSELTYSDASEEEPSSTNPSDVTSVEPIVDPLAEVEVSSEDTTASEEPNQTSAGKKVFHEDHVSPNSAISDSEQAMKLEEEEEANPVVTSSQSEDSVSSQTIPQVDHISDDPVSQSNLAEVETSSGSGCGQDSSLPTQEVMEMDPPTTSVEKNDMEKVKEIVESSEAEAMEQD